jgi:hypothetical protein
MDTHHLIDTSEYPSTHSFFCHSPDPGSYVEQMKKICDEVMNSGSSTIHEAAKHFLIKISSDDDDDSDNDSDDDWDDEDADHDEDIMVSMKPEVSHSALRRFANFYELHDYFTHVIPGTLRGLTQLVIPLESFGVATSFS